jgi:hypothetical protein
MASAASAVQPFQVYGVDNMNRRDFLRALLLGGIFSIFAKKVLADKKPETKPENKLREAMFWKRLD